MDPSASAQACGALAAALEARLRTAKWEPLDWTVAAVAGGLGHKLCGDPYLIMSPCRRGKASDRGKAAEDAGQTRGVRVFDDA